MGVVSGHFRNHSVWHAIVKGWFQHLDRGRFALDAYYLGSIQDAETALARSQAAHFEEGVLVKAKAGDVYSEPIGKMHRGHNPHPELPYLCIALCLTAPDREHVTNVVKAW